MIALVRRRLARGERDRGFTLVEMLVAVILTALVGTAVIATVIGANISAKASKSEQDLNEEARLALNRMARELRQATTLTNVLNADGPDYSSSAVTAVTFSADFNGDGCIDGVNSAGTTTGCTAFQASNPETLTYCWDPSASVRQLYLIAGALSGASCQVSGALPILAGQVTSFKLSYRSNQYLYDADGDGVTTWLELDQAGPPVGNGNGALDATELKSVDSIVIDVSVSDKGKHPQSYTTQVDLRNMS
jgi:prepilin-type N-terminal cleavage/methylation domain-containing protein